MHSILNEQINLSVMFTYANDFFENPITIETFVKAFEETKDEALAFFTEPSCFDVSIRFPG